MDLRVNSSRPNFGMAVYFDKSADNVIKRQLVKVSRKRYDKFMSEKNRIVGEQKDNPNNIYISGTWGNRLVAEVHDSAENGLKSYKTSQGLFHRNGSLKFLKRAEKRANRLEELNKNVETLPRNPHEKESGVRFVDEAEESGVRFADEAEELADEMQEGGGIIDHLKDAAEDAEDGLRL